MKKYLISLSSLALISVMYFDGILDISGRLNRGTLRDDVVRVQTMADETDQLAVESAMRHFRQFADCVAKPETCKSQASY
jgi:hypothetical protein